MINFSKLRKEKNSTPRKRQVFSNRDYSRFKKPRALVAILLVGSVGTYFLITSFAGPTIETDNFERTTLGANWSVVFGAVGIVNNSDLGLMSESPAGVVSWVGSTLAADQFSEGVISSNKASNMLPQVSSRRRASDGARYAFHYNSGPDVATPHWEIKYDGVPTAQTRSLVTNSTIPGPKPGDTLRIETRGSNPVEIKGYLNGTLIVTFNDASATRILNGPPGFAFRLELTTTTTYPTAVWESWAGGSLSTTPTTTQTSWYVAPNGTPTGNGSITSPIDLTTALSAASPARPGDTIWLRGGTYGTGRSTLFNSNVGGSVGSPIIVRNYNNERATVDGGIVANGPYVWYWGLEITNSSLERKVQNSERPPGLNMYGLGNKAINLVVHDVGHPGIGFWNNVGDGGEVYGTLFWGNGLYDLSDPRFPDGWTRGSPIYAQNQNGSRLIKDNISFRNFTTGMKAYTQGGYANGFTFDGNIIFDAAEAGIEVAADTNPINFVNITNNYLYSRPGALSNWLRIGYFDSRQGTANITGNYTVTRMCCNGDTSGITLKNWTNATLSDNTVVSDHRNIFEESSSPGNYQFNNNKYYTLQPSSSFFSRNIGYNFAGWQGLGYDATSTQTVGRPATNTVVVRRNTYEANRSNIVIYNWEGKTSADVNLSAVLATGMNFEVRDAQNFYGPPVASGTYNGSTVNLPLNLTAVAPLTGNVTTINNSHTPAEFNAFVVIPLTGTATPPPPPPPPPTSDTTLPTVQITTPVNGAPVSGVVNVAANASDNVGVSRVEFLVDGTLKNTDTTTPYSFSWDSTATLNGSRNLVAKAYDAAGNTATSSVTVTVSNNTADTQAPTAPSNVTAQAVAYNKVNLSWTASTDNVGVTGYWIIRDGVTIAQLGAVTTYSDTTVNASRTYNYQVKAFDAAGNVSSSPAVVTVTTPSAPDTTAPSIPSNLAATSVSSSQINLTWTASTDNVGVTGYDIYRNGAKIATTTTTSFGSTGLSPNTTYTYYVMARDAAGNTSTASNSSNATTQPLPPPPPASTGTLSGIVKSSTGTVLAGAKVQIIVNGLKQTVTTTSTGNYTFTGLSAGSYDTKYSARGHVSQTIVVNVAAGSTVTQNVTLTKR